MAHKKITGVQQYATGTGTGALTLGAATSSLYRTMQAAGMADGDTMYAHIQHATLPSEWEIVLVTYTASGTTISRSFDSKAVSATGALISFTAGPKIVTEAKLGTGGWDTAGIVGPVSVETFGAIADGVTDCLAAFEAAIAVNGSIVIPAGTYLLSGSLSVSMRQVSIVGEGPGISNLLFASGGLDIAVPTTPYVQFANTTIAQLSFLCSSAGTSTAIKIRQDSVVTDNHISITNVEITGGDGVYGPFPSVTGTSHSSTLINGIASTADILVNSSLVGGSGLPSGLTYVASKTATSVTLNQALTTSTTTTFTFNAGEQEYWLIGIELNGVRQAVLSNIRINGGGAGKTDQGIYLITGDTDAQFDFSLDYCIVSQCTTSLQVEGWFEGLYVDNCNFYTCRDAFVTEHATSTIVGTFAFTNSAFFCSRSPFISNRVSSIQVANCLIARGFAEAAWNPPAAGVLSGANGFYYAGSLIDITGSGGVSNYDLHTITNNVFFSAGPSTNVILMTDVEGATIVSNTIWGGGFTNGFNFQGSSAQVSFDNIVAAFTTITNPVVRGGSTGQIVAGTFILNSNYATDFQQGTFESQAASGTPNIAMTGDIDEAKWLTALGGYNLTLYNDRASQPAVSGISTISYKSRTFSARAQHLSDGGFKTAAYLEAQAGPGDAAVAMTGDIDEAKWIAALGGYNLTFFNDTSGNPEIDGWSSVTHGGRTYYPRVQFTVDGNVKAPGIALFDGGLFATPLSGDAVFGGTATTSADRVKCKATIPGVGIWYWGADGSGGGYKWKLAWDSATFGSPAITVDPTTSQVDLAGPLNVVNYVKTGAIAVASLPAASVGSGSRWMVSDATATTFASVVAGGGSNHVPVYSDGTNWRIG